MTLNTYFAVKYSKIVLVTICFMISLVFVIDLIENARRFSFNTDLIGIFHLTFLKVPKSVYEIIDLIILIASIWFFTSTNKSNELIIVRGAGRSVYTAIFPPLTVTIIFGTLFLCILNPLVATTTKSFLTAKEIYINGQKAAFSIGIEGLWLRQGTALEQSVIRADKANYDGSTLFDVTIISFSETNSAIRRLQAEKAVIRQKNWHLYNVKVWPLGTNISSEKNSEIRNKMIIPSSLTKEEIKERISDPSSVSIWDLKSQITQLKDAGFSALNYQVRFYSELSHPLFLIAMMLVGCATTIKDFVGNKKSLAILSSILIGFSLYYVRNFALLLAENGQVNLIVATWIPPIASIFIATGLIIHMEDG